MKVKNAHQQLINQRWTKSTYIDSSIPLCITQQGFMNDCKVV